MKKSTLVFAVPFVAFFLLCVMFWAGLKLDPSHLPSAKVDKVFPAFQLTDLKNSAPKTEKDIQGQAALVNVWATWCPACRQEHPQLLKLAKEGVPVFGINYKDERGAAIQYLNQHGDPYQFSIFDEEGSLGFDLGVYGAPETYVVSADGIILHRLVGIVTEKNWEQELKPFFTATSKESAQ